MIKQPVSEETGCLRYVPFGLLYFDKKVTVVENQVSVFRFYYLVTIIYCEELSMQTTC